MSVTAKRVPSEESVPRIDFMQTISRDLTHKRRLENVYVTSMDQLSDTEFLCGAYVPQANAYLNDMRSGPNDVTLTVIEIGRQLGIALCHSYMGVGRANVFILNTLQFESYPAYHTTDWAKYDTVSANAEITNQVYRSDGALHMVRAGGDMVVGENKVCRLRSDWTIQSVESGQRLREIGKARNKRNALSHQEIFPPFEAFKIQPIFPVRRSLLNRDLWVAHNGSKFAAALEVDLGNLFFFDHENDHVPGMLILEGMRELAIDVGMRFPRASSGQPRIARIDMGFKNFAELDYPVVLIAEVEDKFDNDDHKELYIRIEAQQFGKTIAEGRFFVD